MTRRPIPSCTASAWASSYRATIKTRPRVEQLKQRERIPDLQLAEHQWRRVHFTAASWGELRLKYDWARDPVVHALGWAGSYRATISTAPATMMAEAASRRRMSRSSK